MSTFKDKRLTHRVLLVALSILIIVSGILFVTYALNTYVFRASGPSVPTSVAASFGINVQRTHFNSDEHTLTPATVARLVPGWSSLPTGGSIFSSPTVVNGVVYVGSLDSKLYAFDANGCTKAICEPLWTSPSTGDALYSSPVVVNGTVFVGSLDHKLYSYH